MTSINKTAAKAKANTEAKARAGIGHNKAPKATVAAFGAALRDFDAKLEAATTAANAAIETASQNVVTLIGKLAKADAFYGMTEARFTSDVAPVIAKHVDRLAIAASVRATYRSVAKGLFLCEANGVGIPKDAPAGLVRQSTYRTTALRAAGVLPALAKGAKRGRKAKATETPANAGADAKAKALGVTLTTGAPLPRFTPKAPVVLTRADLCDAVAMLTGLPAEGERVGKYADLFADVSARRAILTYLDTFETPKAKAPKVARAAPKAKAPKGAKLTVDTAPLDAPV